METNADQLSELMQRYARGEDGVFEELRVHRARATYLAGSNALY